MVFVTVVGSAGRGTRTSRLGRGARSGVPLSSLIMRSRVGRAGGGGLFLSDILVVSSE